MTQSFTEIVTKRIASGATRLPVFDGTALRLRTLLADPDVDVDTLVSLIETDPVLRLANSSFFGGLSRVRNVDAAVLRLGTEKVAQLALLVAQGAAYQVRWVELKPLVAGLWTHAVACALGCQWLCAKIDRPDLASQAFLGGMLHDIGKLLLLRVVDDLRAQNPRFRPGTELLHELLRSAHAAHGEALVRAWNIPDPYPHLVGHHHEIEADKDDTLLLVLRLVDQSCNQLGFGIEAGPETGAAASEEALALRLSEITIAELEVHLEDAVPAAAGASTEGATPRSVANG